MKKRRQKKEGGEEEIRFFFFFNIYEGEEGVQKDWDEARECTETK